jgi:hypothetical protein
MSLALGWVAGPRNVWIRRVHDHDGKDHRRVFRSPMIA